MYAQDSYGFDLVMVSIFDTQIENCSLYKLIKVGNKLYCYRENQERKNSRYLQIKNEITNTNANTTFNWPPFG